MIAQRAVRHASQAIAARHPPPAAAATATATALTRRLYSSDRSAAAAQDGESEKEKENDKALSPRWLSETKSRIGKCITFGMSEKLVDEASSILQTLGRDWRELVAGSEGYLTEEKRAGLHRHKIVWGEQDSMGHVNNVMYVRYAESARCNWITNYSEHQVDNDGDDGDPDSNHPAQKRQWRELLTSRGIGLILKSITVDFKFPMTWPDRISVYHKLRSRPDEATDSLVLDVLIMSELRQRPAARCREESVVYDYRTAQKSTFEPFMLRQLRTTFDLQEAAKAKNRAKVRLIEHRVRQLETLTWDRPDAKEDFGGAPHHGP